MRTGTLSVGNGHLGIIAGPCAVESEEQTVATARAVKAAGPRSRGGSSRREPAPAQGLKEEGLKIPATARGNRLPIVTGRGATSPWWPSMPTSCRSAPAHANYRLEEAGRVGQTGVETRSCRDVDERSWPPNTSSTRATRTSSSASAESARSRAIRVSRSRWPPCPGSASGRTFPWSSIEPRHRPREPGAEHGRRVGAAAADGLISKSTPPGTALSDGYQSPIRPVRRNDAIGPSWPMPSARSSIQRTVQRQGRARFVDNAGNHLAGGLPRPRQSHIRGERRSARKYYHGVQRHGEKKKKRRRTGPRKTRKGIRAESFIRENKKTGERSNSEHITCHCFVSFVVPLPFLRSLLSVSISPSDAGNFLSKPCLFRRGRARKFGFNLSHQSPIVLGVFPCPGFCAGLPASKAARRWTVAWSPPARWSLTAGVPVSIHLGRVQRLYRRAQGGKMNRTHRQDNRPRRYVGSQGRQAGMVRQARGRWPRRRAVRRGPGRVKRQGRQAVYLDPFGRRPHVPEGGHRRPGRRSEVRFRHQAAEGQHRSLASLLEAQSRHLQARSLHE